MNSLTGWEQNDDLHLPVPLSEPFESESAAVCDLRHQYYLPVETGNRESGTELETTEATMVSTERLDGLIKTCQLVISGELGASRAYCEMIIKPEEVIDICRDAKRWREHVRPPKNCDHRLDR